MQPTIALVGTPDEVADEIHNFKEAGISQFILHGWPKWEEMRIFCREVIPLVRQRERTGEEAPPPRAEFAARSSQTNAERGLRTPEL